MAVDMARLTAMKQDHVAYAWRDKSCDALENRLVQSLRGSSLQTGALKDVRRNHDGQGGYVRRKPKNRWGFAETMKKCRKYGVDWKAFCKDFKPYPLCCGKCENFIEE